MKPIAIAAVALAMTSSLASAAPNFEQLERWKAEKGAEQFTADSFNHVAAETATHFVVYGNAGTACPAGNHWLFNKKTKTYRSVDGGTCDDRNFKVVLTADKLTFKSGKKTTAMYPVYLY